MANPRTDTQLWSGGSSQTAAARRKETEAKRKAEKEDKQRILLEPWLDIVLPMIDGEKKKTELQILRFINATSDTKLVKETIAALNLYDDSMTNLKTKLQNLLREPKVKKDKA